MKTLLRPFKFIFSHPLTKNNKFLGILNFSIWQIKSRLNKNEQVINWFEGLKLNVKRGMYGATGCIYVGLPEFEDMGFLLHFLKKDDLFLDIGANVGVYSLLASGIKEAKTIAFEPVPITHSYLKKNTSLNRLNKLITPLNIGLADKNEKLFFTADSDTNNHVILQNNEKSIEVEVKTLDSIAENIITIDTLIKIDVEGFEIKVLEGAAKTLQNPNLLAVIIELNGCGKRYGYDDAEVDKILVGNGFGKYKYNPFTRELITITDFHKEKNTLYLKSSRIEYIQKKITNSAPFCIFNRSI